MTDKERLYPTRGFEENGEFPEALDCCREAEVIKPLYGVFVR